LRLAVLATLGITIVIGAINLWWMTSVLIDTRAFGTKIVLGRIAMSLNFVGFIAIAFTTFFVIRPLLRLSHLDGRLFEATHLQSLLPKAWIDKSGRLLRVNPALCHLFGWDERQLLTQSFEQITRATSTAGSWSEFFRGCSSSDSSHTREFRFTHRDGHTVIGIVTLSTLRNSNGQAVCSVIHIQDVTARSQIEKELRISEARFRAIAKGSPLGILITDPRGQCIFANDVYLRLTGLTADEARDEGWVRAIHPDDRDRIVKAWGQFALKGGEFDHQYRYQRTDKSVYWVRVLASALHEDESVIGYIAMVENITSQRESDLALRESEKRFRKLADSVPALIWMDDKDKAGAYVNKAWIDYTGNAELGDAWTNSVHPDDLAQYLARTAHAWDCRRPYRLEYRLRRNDGIYRWFVVTAIPLSDENGTFSGYIGSCVDIHDSRLAHEELQSAKERAEAASIAKSNFLANISHEFRTPMTAILGFADLLESPGASDLTPAVCIQSIKTSGQHLLAMLNDILDLSKVEAGELAIVPTPTDIEQTCFEVVNMMKPRALEKGLEFGMQMISRLPQAVETDAIRLTQILVNLLGNAIKFTDEGHVKLSVSATESHGKAELVFVVTDTGVGIRREQLERLFTPFFQVDESSTRRHGGTGLGLAISRRLAQRLGGDLTAESDGVTGSTFTLSLSVPLARLPSVATSVVAARAPGDAEEARPLGRVLVAEDGASTRKLLDAILRRAGADVISCEDGQTAFELAMEQRFDVVLLDMLMPELDGYTVARLLRARGNRTPIIALTANAMSGDRERCLSNGCDDYLSKPIDRERLIHTIARYCGVESNSPRLQGALSELPVSTVSELKKAFYKELTGECDRLEQRLIEADASTLKHVLHQIKGSTAAFGFDELSQLAADAEKSIGTGSLVDPAGAEKVQRLLNAMRDVAPALKE
jgi:PAS domain S-box-containing protein